MWEGNWDREKGKGGVARTEGGRDDALGCGGRIQCWWWRRNGVGRSGGWLVVVVVVAEVGR